jgi:hypothetical protein
MSDYEFRCFNNSKGLWIALLAMLVISLLILNGCSGVRADAASEAPPPASVVSDVDLNLFALDHPEQFPLAEASAHPTTSELIVT